MLKIFFITFGIAILVNYLYIPLPEEIKDPWEIRLYLALGNVLNTVLDAGANVSYFPYWYVDMVRLLYVVAFPLSNLVNDSNMNMIETKFDGVEVLMTLPAQNASKLFPGIIFLHGGGFVLSSARHSLPVVVEFTRQLNAAVISVNYRLAPENPFPVPLQDCITATIHLLKNAASYGIDPLRISITGESAGGNLAASVSLKLRERKDLPPLKSQVLIYPFIQVFDFKLPSYQQNSAFIINAKVSSFYALLYIGEDLALIPSFAANNHTSPELKKSKFSNYFNVNHLPKKFTETNYIKPQNDNGDNQLSKRLETKLLNGDAFPLMADNLQGLPPALVLVCQYDVFRDEGLLYAHRLRQAGNKVQEHIVEGGIHGSLNLFRSADMGEETISVITKYLKSIM